MSGSSQLISFTLVAIVSGPARILMQEKAQTAVIRAKIKPMNVVESRILVFSRLPIAVKTNCIMLIPVIR